MASKTHAQLAVLFADNTAGDITPAMLRDFLDTMKPGMAGLWISTPAATTCTDAGTAYKAAGTTTATAETDFTHTTNRLTYIGVPNRHMHIALSTSFTTSGSNDIIGVTIAINGVSQEGSAAKRKVGTGTDIGSTALHWDAELSTGDYIEIFVSNDSTAGTTVTIENGYLFALSAMI